MDKEIRCGIEWWIKREKAFSVSAKAWLDEGRWNWNVYAYIFDSHPLFSKPGLAKELPLHCGCTYDAMKSETPAEGIEYDWQKTKQTLVVGSDYNHIYDDYDHHPSGFDGVPSYVLSDANALVEALSTAKGEE